MLYCRMIGANDCHHTLETDSQKAEKRKKKKQKIESPLWPCTRCLGYSGPILSFILQCTTGTINENTHTEYCAVRDLSTIYAVTEVEKLSVFSFSFARGDWTAKTKISFICPPNNSNGFITPEKIANEVTKDSFHEGCLERIMWTGQGWPELQQLI